MDAVELLFPRKCLGCGKSGRYICEDCLKGSGNVGLKCGVCGRILDNGRCLLGCARSLRGVYVGWKYEGVVKKALIKFKYGFSFKIADELALELSKKLKIEEVFWGKMVVVPVPLYPFRENWRGFNQSEKFGRRVANLMGWEIDTGLVVRSRYTQTQSGLKRGDREGNIAGAFVARGKVGVGEYLIVDDVYTTGSTMRAVAGELVRNGARAVWGLTVAG